jgi:hypothetical protein
LPSTTGYCRKDKTGHRSERKKRKKSRKLLDDLKDKRGYSHLKEEALDRKMRTARFERVLGLSYDRILNE